jgi:hypothetical protein
VCVYVCVCVCVCVCVLHTHTYIHIHVLYSCMFTLTYSGIFMVYLWFTRASPLLKYVTVVILFYFNILIHTPAVLVLYSYFSWSVCCVCCVCVCVYRLTGLVECVRAAQ